MTSLREKLRNHVVSATGIITIANPLYMITETMISHASHVESQHIRLEGTLATYTWLGTVINAGRKFSREQFHITDESSERAKKIHDAAYMATFNLGYCLLLYRNLEREQIAVNTAIGVASGFFTGAPMLYMSDVFQELLGYREMKRSPPWLQKQTPLVRKAAVGVTAGVALAGMLAYYTFAPDQGQHL